MIYLLHVRAFQPLTDTGEYLWVNIFTLIGLLFLILFIVSSLISYFILRAILKKADCRELKILCLRWGILFTIGSFLVILLHFFHILNIYWGIGILLVVITASFVI